MKKLLIFVLVLGMASMAQAVPYFQVATNDACDHYWPSAVITIEVRDNNPVALAGFMIDSITDNTGGLVIGYAAGPQVFSSTFPLDFQFPGTLNVDNQLVEYASGAAGSGVASGAMIYSFDYHVPNVPFSTWIEIQSDDDGGIMWFPPKFDYTNGSSYTGAVTPVFIHVGGVPEPATIALLGLGGLLLRRRK